MKLEHLRITNCSRVSDIDIDVRDNMVLIGPNGSGKSTVLLCLDMLLGMSDSLLRETMSESFIRDTSRAMTVEAWFTRPKSAENNMVRSGYAVKLVAELHESEITIERTAPSPLEFSENGDSQDNAFGWTLLRSHTSLSAETVQPLPFDKRSDGSRALSSMSPYSEPQEATNILAIDEPEAHLHPSSQRSLVKNLKSGGNQLILVTHSPTVAESFEPDEIVVIRLDGTAVQPREHFLSKSAGTLARWWIGRQLEPLTAGTVIAVEGPSDRVIVSKVAIAMGLDLDRRDIVIVETNGCGDMKVVETVFGGGGFGIPLFELIDDDASDEAERRLGIGRADLERRNVFVSTADLEDEYVRAIGAGVLWDKLKASKAFSKKTFMQCKVGPDGYPTELELARFIREKSYRKIPAALVAADLINAGNAHSVESVARLLDAATS